MDIITEKAFAKLNITLDIIGKRSDGYHDMSMIMQTVSLADELTFIPNNTGNIRAVTNTSYIPEDKRNLAVAAAETFFDALGKPEEGMTIKIDKRIPVGAGMAGGSADAGAVLRALNRAYGYPLSREELLKAAEKVGSDVPFCTQGGTALANGRGEKMTALPTVPYCVYVICKPTFSISTPELFKLSDAKRIKCHPDTQGALQAIKKGDLSGLCRRLYNVFEDVDDKRMKTVAEIKGRLLDAGALGAVMTGTGSAVFGIFTDMEKAEDAAGKLRKEIWTATAENVAAAI